MNNSEILSRVDFSLLVTHAKEQKDNRKDAKEDEEDRKLQKYLNCIKLFDAPTYRKYSEIQIEMLL